MTHFSPHLLLFFCILLTINNTQAMFASIAQKLLAPTIGALWAHRYSKPNIVQAQNGKNDKAEKSQESHSNTSNSLQELSKILNTGIALEVAKEITNQMDPEVTRQWLKARENLLIAKEQRKLAEFIFKASLQSSGNQVGTNEEDKKEAHFYEPKRHILSEAQEQIDVRKRIEQRYIGNLSPKIEDLIFYFSNHEECKNINIQNKLLLIGNPGVGKSYLVKVLAEEMGIPTLTFSASFFHDKYIGEASRKIRKAFDTAKKFNKPIFIFIDEIDALATQRKENTHEEHRATLITLLTELQDLQDNKNIFVFAATNTGKKQLDDALVSRFMGSICKIKNLDERQKSRLYKKVFADRRVEIDDAFAQRLAEVTRINRENDSAYVASTELNKAMQFYNDLIKECLNKESGLGYASCHQILREYAKYFLETYEKRKAIKPLIKKDFSNRDIEHIATTAILRKFADCKKNNKCDEKLCHYVRQVMDETGKKGTFSEAKNSKFCDGI